MTETILVIVAVFAALAVVARRAAMPGRNFPEMPETGAELPDRSAPEEDADRPASPHKR